MLMDVAITGDRSVIKKEARKVLSYVKAKVIPVIIWETGTISK